MKTFGSDDPLLDRQEAARYLGIKPQTLAVWASSGRYSLPYVRVGRRALYRRSNLDDWLAARTITQIGELREK